MSTFESIFWHVLGYAAMPVIILSGFAAVAVVCIGMLALGRDRSQGQDNN
ncbi:TIGR02808 family protein [Photobacterium aquae]|nr:TIGR02808 family protein [Photobacterium aquae]